MQYMLTVCRCTCISVDRDATHDTHLSCDVGGSASLATTHPYHLEWKEAEKSLERSSKYSQWKHTNTIQFRIREVNYTVFSSNIAVNSWNNFRILHGQTLVQWLLMVFCIPLFVEVVHQSSRRQTDHKWTVFNSPAIFEAWPVLVCAVIFMCPSNGMATNAWNG